MDVSILSKIMLTSEMLAVISIGFATGWGIGWWITNGKISELRREQALYVNHLNECRRINESFEMQHAARRSGTRRADDFKYIEGIGPKTETLLKSKGILTFGDLADVELTELFEILRRAGSSFQVYDPSSWPLQSSLARDGKWDELNAFQIKLERRSSF